MTTLIFPDVNLFVALTAERHIHHRAAHAWYVPQPAECALAFCRFTQLGFLRLLTTASMMKEDVRTNKQAWADYDIWIEGGGAVLIEEPSNIHNHFYAFSSSVSISPKLWADAYLAAFSIESGLPLATFDRALAHRVDGAIFLQV